MDSPSHEYDFKRIIQDVMAKQSVRKDYFCSIDSPGLKYYALGMFPYPSGNAHMGHVRVYTITDIKARFKKLKGFTVLNPLGWDAFGLPAENAAIKQNLGPAEWTAFNINRMKNEQFAHMGWSFDMTKEISSCSPDYYKWTQWIFLQFFKYGKAYRAKGIVNWCPEDQTVLANEQVIDGRCWRDGVLVEKRYMDQWFLKITDYAQRLWDDIPKLIHWPKEAISVQKNWINKSCGTRIDFPCPQFKQKISVFTTRADTLFGVTALVLAPEHPLAATMAASLPDPSLKEYIDASMKKSAVDRVSERDKTGVATGMTAQHPLLDQPIPIWVGDYVLGDYGTGAVMCVPAHDQRDFEFAKKYTLNIQEVVRSTNGESSVIAQAFTEDGILIGSNEFSGMSSAAAREGITAKLAILDLGQKMVNYNLRDWSVGRQRYWGCPIPIIDCPNCGTLPVPEKDLPVLLPERVEFIKGKADITSNQEFVEVPCPQCGGRARRETDTLDTFMCSSWYAFRFIDPTNDKSPFDGQKVSTWMPIDFYVGGLEHAALHMIYFRFLTKFFHDIGLISIDEPVDNFFCNGMVTKDGYKMSKSRGNVVVPTDIVNEYGPDALRLYIMSDTPAEMEVDWDADGIHAKLNFLKKIYRAISVFLDNHGRKDVDTVDLLRFGNRELLFAFYLGLKQLEANLEQNLFHNAIARLYEITNPLLKALAEFVGSDENNQKVLCRLVRDYLVVCGIFAPFLAESLYARYFDSSVGIYNLRWPIIEERFTKKDVVSIAVQINGKKRAVLNVAKDVSRDEIDQMVQQEPSVRSHLNGKSIQKTVYVPNKIYNVVIG